MKQTSQTIVIVKKKAQWPKLTKRSAPTWKKKRGKGFAGRSYKGIRVEVR